MLNVCVSSPTRVFQTTAGGNFVFTSNVHRNIRLTCLQNIVPGILGQPQNFSRSPWFSIKNFDRNGEKMEKKNTLTGHCTQRNLGEKNKIVNCNNHKHLNSYDVHKVLLHGKGMSGT